MHKYRFPHHGLSEANEEVVEIMETLSQGRWSCVVPRPMEPPALSYIRSRRLRQVMKGRVEEDGDVEGNEE